MNQYRQYTPGDEQPVLDGDRSFRGVDLLTEPAAVGAGLVSFARNCRFRHGRIETRPGIRKVNWAQRAGTSFPLQFPFTFDEPLPFVAVYGVGRFEDTNGVGWVFLAGSVLNGVGQVFVTRPNNGLQVEALPAEETIVGPVEFVQANDKLLLFRGEDQTPLVLTQVGRGFRALAAPIEGSGLSVLPNAARGLWFQNRVIVPFGRDQAAVSDVLDPEHYAALTSTFEINQGSSDRLVGVYKFNDQTIIAAKEGSLYAITNLVADAAGRFSTANLEEITRGFGFVAARSVVQVGADLLGLSQIGVMSIRQTEQNKIQGMVMPLSAPIEPLIKRINWQYASGACAAYWDSKYYLAVPLDDAEKLANQLLPADAIYDGTGAFKLYGVEPGKKYRVTFGANEQGVVVFASDGVTEVGYDASLGVVDVTIYAPTNVSAYITILASDLVVTAVTATVQELYTGVNNAVLVYDFVTQAWAGYDEAEGLTVAGFATLRYQGEERLFFISADGFLNLYEDGFEDEVFRWQGSAETPTNGFTWGVQAAAIETEWITRGYGTLQLQNDGLSRADLGETRARGALLAVRTWAPRLSLWERPDGVNEEAAIWTAVTRSTTTYTQPWDARPWDRTNVNDDHGTPYREDYAVALGDADELALGSGVNFELHQETLERVRVRGRGRAVQLRGLCDQGRVEVRAIEMVSQAGRRRNGTLG